MCNVADITHSVADIMLGAANILLSATDILYFQQLFFPFLENFPKCLGKSALFPKSCQKTDDFWWGGGPDPNVIMITFLLDCFNPN